MQHWQPIAIAVLIALVNIVAAVLKHRAKRQEAERRRQRAAPMPGGGGPGASRAPVTAAPAPPRSVTVGTSPRERLDAAGLQKGMRPQVGRHEAPSATLSTPGRRADATIARTASQPAAPGGMRGGSRDAAAPVRRGRTDPRVVASNVTGADVPRKSAPTTPKSDLPAPQAAVTMSQAFAARPPRQADRAKPHDASAALSAVLGEQHVLRRAVLLSEILAPPVALRDR